MSIRTEINRITAAKTAIATAIAGKGVDVPNGTQIDGMAPLIDGISSGGIALDVMTASALPAAVTDGQIVVITDTTPGTVYIDTDEPASPATGDVWVKLEAEADVKLELSEESTYLRGGLTAAAQWDGNTLQPCDGYLGVAGTWMKFAEALPLIGTALNDISWEQISAIAAAGKAAEYFSVGDAKEIVINGTVGNTTFSNLSVWAFIIGINHNSSIEGNNTIHFQIGKNSNNSATNICLVDSYYNKSPNNAGYFTMNTSQTNSGGWKECMMRTSLLGNSNPPTNPLSNSLIAALPSDLRGVMKGVTKYSDNKGNGLNTASYVTETTDYLWLPAEYEVFGSRSKANSAEQNHQKQYDYYASGNSRIMYQHNATSTAVFWWLRSVLATQTGSFCDVNTTGTAHSTPAQYSYGIAPCFCV